MSSTKRTMNDLRDHLFDCIEALKKPTDDGLDINSANAICRAAGRLIQTAEVEIKYQSMVNRGQEINKASAFLTNQA